MKPALRFAPWFTALFGIGLTLGLFYPGYMSWDSAFQWWQARHGMYDSVQPPLMSMIWRLCDQVWSGPGGMFVLQITLIWTALAAFASALDRPTWQKCLLILLLGFWPPLFGLSLHIWKDLWTMQAFAWAVALLVMDLRTPARKFRILAVFALCLACAFRHNAITGALPFLFWIAHREYRSVAIRHSRFWPWAITVFLAMLVFTFSKLPNLDSRVRENDSVWSVVTLWDASAVSLSENKLLIPDELKDPSLNLQDLQRHFSDYTNTTIYESGKLKHGFDVPYSPEQKKALAALAWSLPFEHGHAYFRHRLRLAELLYGWDQQGLPDGQVLMPEIVHYGDNPPVLSSPSPYRPRVIGLLQSWIDTPVFAAWIYLGIALLLAGGIFLRNTSATGRLAITVAVSSLAYALPLALVSGSAEFRYLAWPLLACLMSLALMFSAWRAPENR